MKHKALGLIETYGYIPAIEAADASLKAANVKLLGWEKIKGGLVSIKLQGDVSAVKSAVDAGANAASFVGKVISTTVIARPGEGLNIIIQNGKKEEKKEEKTKRFDSEEVKRNSKDDEMPIQDTVNIEFEGGLININDKEELENMKVVELRRLARLLENINIDNKDIKYAKKDELILAILSFAKRGEE